MWLQVVVAALEILAPVFVYILKALGVSENRKQLFLDWVSDLQRRKNELAKVQVAGNAQDADLAGRIEAEKK